MYIPLKLEQNDNINHNRQLSSQPIQLDVLLGGKRKPQPAKIGEVLHLIEQLFPHLVQIIDLLIGRIPLHNLHHLVSSLLGEMHTDRWQREEYPVKIFVLELELD